MNIQDGREGTVTLERPDSIPYLNDQSVYTPVLVYKQYGCQGEHPRPTLWSPQKSQVRFTESYLTFNR